MASKVQIIGKATPKVRSGIEEAAKKLFRHFKLRQVSLDVFFLPDAEMKKLKKKYLPKKKGPANTLSFEPVEDFPNPETKLTPVGEIYLNQDLTENKLDKILPLLIHSFLHLRGYHHEDERDMIEMSRLATQIQAKIDKGKQA